MIRVPACAALLPLFAFSSSCQSTETEAPISTVISADERNQLTASACLMRLKDGNKRFVSERLLPRNWKAQMEASVVGASPFAAVLTDVDSRLPLELAFDAGIGELVQVRTPGPTLTSAALASLEDAVARGVRTVVVMGLSQSRWTAEAVEGRSAAALGGAADSLQQAVAQTSTEPSDWVVDSLSFSDAVMTSHVKNVVGELVDRSPALAAELANGGLEVVPAYYDIGTGAVIWL